MKEDKKVPQLRFPEFTDAWKQRKLSESAKFSKGNGYSKSDVTTKGIPLVLYGRLYTNYETVISNIDTYSELKKDGSVVSKGGEILVPASGETAEDISRASVIKDSGVLIGGDLNIIYPSNDIIPSFLALTITNGNIHKEMTKLAQGKTVVHLHNSDLSKIRFYAPTYNEQIRITEIFSNIDSNITLQQRKLNSLQKLKKGLLQKMFPKNGENIPEIRFPEFSDAWKQRKLREVVKEFYNGKTPYRQNKAYWGGNVNWLTSGDLNRDVVTNTIEKITEEGQKASRLRIIPKGTLVIAIMGLEAAGTRGNCGILGIDTTINQACMALIANESIATKDFLFQWYKAFGNRLALKFTQGTKQQNYNEELLGNLDISYPSLKEQQQIGAFFTQLDNTITLQQRKLESLQKLKKGLLQQMFI